MVSLPDETSPEVNFSFLRRLPHFNFSLGPSEFQTLYKMRPEIYHGLVGTYSPFSSATRHAMRSSFRPSPHDFPPPAVGGTQEGVVRVRSSTSSRSLRPSPHDFSPPAGDGTQEDVAPVRSGASCSIPPSRSPALPPGAAAVAWLPWIMQFSFHSLAANPIHSVKFPVPAGLIPVRTVTE